jgi:hypothetical protein
MDRPWRKRTVRLQYELVRTPSNAVCFILQRGSTLTNQELVVELNAAGMRTGMGRLFDIPAVQWLRHVHRVPSPSPLQAGESSVNGFAARLGVSMSAVYYWIEHGQLAARRTATGRLCVANTIEVEAACRKLIADSRHMQVASNKRMGVEAV